MPSNRKKKIMAIRPAIPIKCAVCNTGPMMSAFQGEQVEILQALYNWLYIPRSALGEYTQHHSKMLLEELLNNGFLRVCDLSETEKQLAQQHAQEIADHQLTKARIPQNHYAEAAAIALMSRTELAAVEILLDELAARAVAKLHGFPVIGFAGILIRACQVKFLTPAAVRQALFKCQAQGTHYATAFIEQVYRQLQEEQHE